MIIFTLRGLVGRWNKRNFIRKSTSTIIVFQQAELRSTESFVDDSMFWCWEPLFHFIRSNDAATVHCWRRRRRVFLGISVTLKCHSLRHQHLRDTFPISPRPNKDSALNDEWFLSWFRRLHRFKWWLWWWWWLWWQRCVCILTDLSLHLLGLCCHSLRLRMNFGSTCVNVFSALIQPYTARYHFMFCKWNQSVTGA